MLLVKPINVSSLKHP